MDNNNSNNNNGNKPNNKVNLPKFNLNWMYMIIALMLLGLWWGSDSKGAGSKAVTYSELQDYVKMDISARCWAMKISLSKRI